MKKFQIYELEKNLKTYLKGRVSVSQKTLIAFLILGSFGFTNTLTLEDAKEKIDTENVLIEGVYKGEAESNFLTLKDESKFEGEVTLDVKSKGGETHLNLVGENISIDKLNLKINPNENVHSRPKGVWLKGKSKATIEDLNVDLVLRSKITDSKFSADSNASYGVGLGINEKVHGSGEKSDETILTVNNMNITVKNTEDTVFNKYRVSPATVYFTHQLSGIRLLRKDGAKTTLIANGKVDVKVEDVSKDKSGDYLVGVYVSGEEATATFNGETNITIIGEGENSAAIKIGKPFENFAEGKAPKVIVNGKLNVDTTKATESGAIRLFTNNTSFEVTGKNTDDVSIINSGNSAIIFDTQDYILGFDLPLFGYSITTRNSNAENQKVKLKNTKITTTSVDKSLILVKAERAKEQSMGIARNFDSSLNGGENYSSKNAIFELYGEKSEAIAAQNGWLIEARAGSDIFSSITANIKDGAKVEGLINKEAKSEITLNLENNAEWKLKLKGLDEKISTLSNLNIDNSILNASEINTQESYDKSNIPKKLEKELIDSLKALDDFKSDKISEPDDEDIDEYIASAEKRVEKAKLAIEKWAIETNKPKITAHSEYIIKLTSDGNLEDGILRNGGIVTLDNTSYIDKLVIEGKYEGKDNSKILLNTLWNEKSGINGENSKSDLIEITGEVIGKTEIIARGEGKIDNQVDGFVGVDEGDEGHRSTIVIKAPLSTSEEAFFGKAKTANETELELKSEIKEDKRVFFWEVTKLGNKDIEPFLVGPKTNMDQARRVFGRLNERRIQTKLFDIGKATKYPMPWVRLYGGEMIYDNSEKTRYMEGTIGINLGFDYYLDSKKENLTGIYLGYSNTFKDLVSKITNPGKNIGRVTTDMFSIGITNTYEKEKFYADIVLQLSGLNNKYKLSDSKIYYNSGAILTGSIEIGNPIYFVTNEEKGEKYLVEPQAQLIYQFGKNADIKEQNIVYGYSHSLTGRLGMRVGYSTAKKNTAKNGMGYGLFNVWGEYSNSNKLSRKGKKFNSNYPNIWIEVGLGANLPVSKHVSSYFEVSLEKSVYGGNKYGGKGTVGINYEK